MTHCYGPEPLSALEKQGRREEHVRAARDDKAARIVAALDSACKVLGRPRLAGKAGLVELMDLPATAWFEIHRMAKCDRPPSYDTLKIVQDQIRGRDA